MTEKSRTRWGALVATCAVLSLVGCGDDTGGRVESLSCEVDPTLVASRRACAADDDCPCGTSCELGECIAECMRNEDCTGGGRCDRFGHCRAASDTSRLPTLSTDASLAGQIELSTPLLRLAGVSMPRPVTLRATGANLGRVRVTVTSPLEVSCDGGAFGTECRLDMVSTTRAVTLSVRTSARLADGATSTLTVYAGDERREVTISMETEGGRPPVEDRLRDGRYTGTATVVGMGVTDDPSTLELQRNGVSIPIDAKVFLSAAGTGVVVLEDSLGVIAPTRSWAAGLTVRTATEGSVDFPTIPYLSGEAFNGAPVEVLADAPSTTWTSSGESLAFEIAVRYRGVLLGDRTPTVRLAIGLTRVDDLGAGDIVPRIPADATPSLPVTRGIDATPWEAVAARAVSPTPDDILTATDAERRAFLGTFGRAGDGGTLRACGIPARVSDALGQFALLDAWGAVTPFPCTTSSTNCAGASEYRAPADYTGATRGAGLLARIASAVALADTAAVSATLSSSLTARNLPCEADFANVNVTTFAGAACTTAPSLTLAIGRLDTCDAMAAEVGCEIVETTGTLTANVTLGVQDGASVCSAPGVALVGTVRRACRMPVLPASCGEMALCSEPTPTGTTPGSVDASFFGDTVLEYSGDLRCATGDRTAAIEADVTSETASLAARALVGACAMDLGRIRTMAPPTGARVYGERLAELFSSEATCIDAARFVFALGLAGDADRRHALAGDAGQSPAASALAGRLLNRWLQQHGFEAREAAQSERIAAVFRQNPRPGDPTIPPVATTLASSLRGWDLLLHPRFATALAEQPASVIYAPDYRPLALGAAVTTLAHHEQTTPSAVVVLETLAAQLSLVRPALEAAALQRDETQLELFASVLRRLLVVQPFAATANARARAYGTAESLPLPNWATRYDRAARDVEVVVGQLTTAALSIRDGLNPLGIEETDTPLYYLGDEEGSTTRFAAVSDFLIGPMPGSVTSGSNWAPEIVMRARDALDGARASYLERLDRDIARRQTQAELDGQLEDIRNSFGAELGSICYPPNIATADLLEDWANFDENNCYLNSFNPTCVVDTPTYAALMTADQVQYQMCLVHEIRASLGSAIGFGNTRLNTIADRYTECTPRYPADCPDGGRFCVECRIANQTYTEPLTPDTFRALGGVDTVPLRLIEDVTNRCQALFPGVDYRLPSIDDVPNSPVELRDCYNGSLGEAVLALRGAQQDLEIANAEYDEYQATYDIQMRGCIAQAQSNANIEALTTQHNETMTTLRTAKAVMDGIAAAASAVKDCASAVGSDNKFGVAGGIACGAAVVEGAANVASIGLETAMDEAQQSHEALVMMLENDADEAACLNDADLALVGQRAAALRVTRAIDDVEAAHYQVRELRVAARTVHDDGRLALERARARFVPPLDHDLWLDDSIERYTREMRFARRLTYLSVRAVEYETQQSLSSRDAVLRAVNPDQLWAVLEELWATAGTRGVNGARPSDLKVVLSLRQHLLQIADQSALPNTEQNLSAVDRFRLLLQAPRYAVYGNDGVYRGQQIPFQLAPLAAIQLGQAQGIPVIASNDCAERVWSVNASVLGGENLYRGDDPSFVRIDLLKSNTFYSQWCTSTGRTDDFQVASVRPSRNLFREPTYAATYGMNLGVSNEQTLFTRARIEAYFNVARADLEADDYANGQTSELAARGLYGEYALFIPAEVLSRAGGAGLDLNEVEDILLRLDYVSVAR